jgi:hypothetical protein
MMFSQKINVKSKGFQMRIEIGVKSHVFYNLVNSKCKLANVSKVIS